MTKKRKSDDLEAAAIGVVALIMFAIGIVWFSFVGWCLYTLITWLVNK